MKKFTLLSTITLFIMSSSCTSALVQATPTLTPSATITNMPTVTPFPTITPIPTATPEPIYAMAPVQCGVTHVFYAGMDINSDPNIINFDYVLPEAEEALKTYEGYNLHRGYDFLVPEDAVVYPVFNETGKVVDIWTKNPSSGYQIEIVYENSPATQIADVMDVLVSVGDKVNRDTPLGLPRDVYDSHTRLRGIFSEYGMHHVVHVSFREKPSGGDKIQIPKEYGSPAEFPCK